MNLLEKPPQSWTQAVSQLRHAVDSGRFPQAILLTGPAGIGKCQLAMDLAALLSCSSPNAKPCGKCFSCKTAYDPGATDKWIAPIQLDSEDRQKSGDRFREIVDSKIAEQLTPLIKNPFHTSVIPVASSITVDQIRLLEDRLSLAADGVRTVIVLEADRMNEASANALLKTLEEVPPRTYFILTCSARHNLMQTIQSRCMPMHLSPLTHAEIKNFLKDAGYAEVSADILGMGMGSVGMAMQCLEMDLNTLLGQVQEFTQLLQQKQWGPLFLAMDQWFEKDAQAAIFFLEVLGVFVEDGLRLQAGATLRLPDQKDKHSILHSPDHVTRILAAIHLAQNRFYDRKGGVSMIMQAMALQCQ